MTELDEAVKWVSAVDVGHNKQETTQSSDNDELEPALENSSNKGQGPAGENL